MRTKRHRCVSVEHIVNASPEAVFAVPSNPRRGQTVSAQLRATRLDSQFENLQLEEVCSCPSLEVRPA